MESILIFTSALGGGSSLQMLSNREEPMYVYIMTYRPVYSEDEDDPVTRGVGTELPAGPNSNIALHLHKIKVVALFAFYL